MKNIFLKVAVLILSPFVKIIRYGTLKFMKKLKRPDDKRPVLATANHLLDEIVLPSVFSTFNEKIFRELTHFKKLSVLEHDRIFNELEVTGICIADYYLETVKQFVKDGDFHFWRDVKNELSRQFQKKLEGYGIDSSSAKLMRKLVDIRYEEYDNLAEKVWDASGKFKTELKSLDPEMKRLASMIQATAVGTSDHIRRGKVKEGDPLIKYLNKWLLVLQKRIGKLVKKL